MYKQQMLSLRTIDQDSRAILQTLLHAMPHRCSGTYTAEEGASPAIWVDLDGVQQEVTKQINNIGCHKGVPVDLGNAMQFPRAPA